MSLVYVVAASLWGPVRIEAARAAGARVDKAVFDASLKKIVKAKPIGPEADQPKAKPDAKC